MTTISGQKTKKEVMSAAAAMELLQSGLLIHDDIMDQDTTRRGDKTIFAQYGVNHFGESLGICAGDIGFFLGFELLADTPTILSLVVTEFTKVGIAQMQDVATGTLNEPVNEHELLSLYQYKTARYTFSLPLMIGATLAGQSPKTIKTLETLGEHLGIIFQLKDDEFDQISDQREGKKTLLALYGKDRTEKKISDLNKKAKRLIDDLPITKPWKRVFLELLEYNTRREK